MHTFTKIQNLRRCSEVPLGLDSKQSGPESASQEGKSRPRLASRSTETHTEPSAANGQSIGKQHQNPLLSVHDSSRHKNKAISIQCLYHPALQQSQDTPQRVA